MAHDAKLAERGLVAGGPVVRGQCEREGKADDVCGGGNGEATEAAGSGAAQARDALDRSEPRVEDEVAEDDLDELRGGEEYRARRRGHGIAIAQDEGARRGDQGRVVALPSNNVEGGGAQSLGRDDGIARTRLAKDEVAAAADLSAREDAGGGVACPGEEDLDDEVAGRRGRRRAFSLALVRPEASFADAR